ncbi:MAG: MFS transporter, partial [Bacteroidales bacterium]|nr:MFS transporter [Bacteroidales bacterium]
MAKSQAIKPGYLFTPRYTNYVFSLLFLLYMFDYIDRMVVSSLTPFIQADWGISDTQVGALASVVYWSIVVLTLPISALVDRWSRHKTIGAMATIWSLATAACALTSNFSGLMVARGFIGTGEAGYAPGGSAMISAMYPKERRSWIIGLWNASIPLGAAIGVALGGIIATHWGWKSAFGIVAIPGLMIAILFFMVKDYKTIALVKQKANAKS